MDKSIYLDKENWLGSYYELAIEYSPSRENEHLLKAVHALWNCQEIRGPVEGPYGDFNSLPLFLEPTSYHRLYGEIKLTEDKIIGCLTNFVREKGGSDWLVLSIPTRMLELAYSVTYPLTISTNLWLNGINDTFIAIAEKICALSPFNLAIIGEEASGYRHAHTINVDDLIKGGYLVSSELVQQLGPHVSHTVLPTGLCWFPFA